MGDSSEKCDVANSSKENISEDTPGRICKNSHIFKDASKCMVGEENISNLSIKAVKSHKTGWAVCQRNTKCKLINLQSFTRFKKPIVFTTKTDVFKIPLLVNHLENLDLEQYVNSSRNEVSKAARRKFFKSQSFHVAVGFESLELLSHSSLGLSSSNISSNLEETSSGAKDFTDCSMSSFSESEKEIEMAVLAQCSYCSLEHLPSALDVHSGTIADCKILGKAFKTGDPEVFPNIEKSQSKKQAKKYLCEVLITKKEKVVLTENQLKSLDRECRNMMKKQLKSVIPDHKARLCFIQQLIEDGRYLNYINYPRFRMLLNSYLENGYDNLDKRLSKRSRKNKNLFENSTHKELLPSQQVGCDIEQKPSHDESEHRNSRKWYPRIPFLSLENDECLIENHPTTDTPQALQQTIDIETNNRNLIEKLSIHNTVPKKNKQQSHIKQNFLCDGLVSQEKLESLTTRQCKSLNKSCKKAIRRHIKQTMPDEDPELAFEKVIQSKNLTEIIKNNSMFTRELNYFLFDNAKKEVCLKENISISSEINDQQLNQHLYSEYILDRIIPAEDLKLLTEIQRKRLNNSCKTMLMNHIETTQATQNSFLAFQELINSEEDLKKYIDYRLVQNKVEAFLKSNKGNKYKKGTLNTASSCDFILDRVISDEDIKLLTEKQQKKFDRQCRRSIMKYIRETQPTMTFQELVDSGEDLKQYVNYSDLQARIKKLLRDSGCVSTFILDRILSEEDLKLLTDKQQKKLNNHCQDMIKYRLKENQSRSKVIVSYEELIKNGENLKEYINHPSLNLRFTNYVRENRINQVEIPVEGSDPTFILDRIISGEDMKSLTKNQRKTLNRQCRSLIINHLKETQDTTKVVLIMEELVKDGADLKKYMDYQSFQLNLIDFLRINRNYENGCQFSVLNHFFSAEDLKLLTQQQQNKLNRDCQDMIIGQITIDKNETQSINKKLIALEHMIKNGEDITMYINRSDLQRMLSQVSTHNRGNENRGAIPKNYKFILDRIMPEEDLKLLTEKERNILNDVCLEMITQNTTSKSTESRFVALEELINGGKDLRNYIDDSILQQRIFKLFVNKCHSRFILDRILPQEYLTLLTENQKRKLNVICQKLIMKHLTETQPSRNQHLALEEVINSGEDLKNYVDYLALHSKLSGFPKDKNYKLDGDWEVMLDQSIYSKFILNDLITLEDLELLTEKQQTKLNRQGRKVILNHIKATQPVTNRLSAFKELISKGKDLRKLIDFSPLDQKLDEILKSNGISPGKKSQGRLEDLYLNKKLSKKDNLRKDNFRKDNMCVHQVEAGSSSSPSRSNNQPWFYISRNSSSVSTSESLVSDESVSSSAEVGLPRGIDHKLGKHTNGKLTQKDKMKYEYMTKYYEQANMKYMKSRPEHLRETHRTHKEIKKDQTLGKNQVKKMKQKQGYIASITPKRSPLRYQDHKTGGVQVSMTVDSHNQARKQSSSGISGLETPGTQKKKKMQKQWRMPGKENFEDFIKEEDAIRGIEAGELVKGFVRINPKNPKVAYLSHSNSTEADYIINSLVDRNRALEGDEVVLRVKPDSESLEGSKTAKVVFILNKVHSRITIGRLVFLKNNMDADFYPRDRRFPILKIPKIFWPDGFEKRPSRFETVLFSAQLSRWQKNQCPCGILLECLGESGDFKVEAAAILKEYSLDVTPFPPEFNVYLPQSDSIPEEEFTYRDDFRKQCIFTIDPLTARDLDDAVSCRELPNGNYEVGVHISDAAFYLAENTPLDEKVCQRATTVYMVDRAYHMLPVEMCLHCSLLPGKDKLAFSVIWEMTKNAEVISCKFARSIINSCAQLAYEHAQMMIEDPNKEFAEEELPTIHNGFTPEDLSSTVNTLQSLALQMRNNRLENGALKIDQIKLSFVLDPITGKPLEFNKQITKDANRLIEEFMLLANMSVAEKIHDTYPNLAFLRNHESPKIKMLTELQKCLETFGMHIDTSSSKSIRLSLEKYQTDDYFGKCRSIVLNHLLTKPMVRAQYFCSGDIIQENLAHYALSIPIYTHFTSPIRRYADIMVHRLLAASLGYVGEPKWNIDQVTCIAANCNNKKWNAKKAGEASSELYLIHYIDANQPCILDAIVIDVKEKSYDVLVLDIGTVVRLYLNKLGSDVKVTKESVACKTLDISVAVDDEDDEDADDSCDKKVWKHTLNFPKTDELEPVTLVIEMFTIIKVALSKVPKKNKLEGKLLRPVQKASDPEIQL